MSLAGPSADPRVPDIWPNSHLNANCRPLVGLRLGGSKLREREKERERQTDRQTDRQGGGESSENW